MGNKPNLNYLLFLFLSVMIIGCQNQEKPAPDNYEIVDEEKPAPDNYEIVAEEKRETHNKAQLVMLVVYKDTIYTKEILEKIALDVYDKNKNKNVFKKYDAPTVFGVNIYTSKEQVKNDKGAWICMLSKFPNDFKPRLSFNDFKINSLQGLNDNVKSEDEIVYENLTKYLKERDLELCSFYNQLGDIELECIHKANAKYPDYKYPDYDNYSEKLMKEETQNLIRKYNLADSIFSLVGAFGMGYCK